MVNGQRVHEISAIPKYRISAFVKQAHWLLLTS